MFMQNTARPRPHEGGKVITIDPGKDCFAWIAQETVTGACEKPLPDETLTHKEQAI
jgi:hypothetical protein